MFIYCLRFGFDSGCGCCDIYIVRELKYGILLAHDEFAKNNNIIRDKFGMVSCKITDPSIRISRIFEPIRRAGSTAVGLIN